MSSSGGGGSSSTGNNPAASAAFRKKALKLTNKVIVQDSQAVHRCLDESVCRLLNGTGKFSGDTMLSNLKILLGALAIISAIVSHFYPIPFPKNRYLLLFCAVVYFFIATILQVLSWFVEKNFFYVSTPVAYKGNRAYCVRASSYVPVYGSEYTLSCELAEVDCSNTGFWHSLYVRLIAGYRATEILVSSSSSIKFDKVFDSQGYVYPPALNDMLTKMIAPFKEKVK